MISLEKQAHSNSWANRGPLKRTRRKQSHGGYPRGRFSCGWSPWERHHSPSFSSAGLAVIKPPAQTGQPLPCKLWGQWGQVLTLPEHNFSLGREWKWSNPKAAKFQRERTFPLCKQNLGFFILFVCFFFPTQSMCYFVFLVSLNPGISWQKVRWVQKP